MKSEVKEPNTETTSRKWARPKWHRVYYFLALFDVLVVLMGLFLNYQIVSSYDRSVAVNQEWAKRLNDYEELDRLAGDVDAPGNDVFDSHDVDGESARMRDALRVFNERMITIEKDLQNQVDSGQLAEEGITGNDIKILPEKLREVKSAMVEMTAEAELIFAHFRQDQPDLAGRRMATMDRKYANLRDSLNSLNDDVNVIQEKLFVQEEAAVNSLRKFEYLIAAFVLLMVIGATLYGRKINNKMEGDAREKEQHIEDLQTAEKALSRRERELTDFIDNAAVGMHWIGPDGTILWANKTEMEMLGYTPEEYIGHHISEFHADRATIEDILQRFASNETLNNYEARLRRKDGAIRHVLINSNVWREDGKFVHTRCFTRDITEGKQAEEKQSWLAAIVESSDDAIISKSLDGRILSWNPSAERLYGYAPSEAIGQSVMMLIPPDRTDEEPRIIERIARGESIDHYETMRLRKDGTLVDVSLTISPVKDADGQIIGASKIARDITERKCSEEALARAYEELETRVEQRTAELSRTNDTLQSEIVERKRVEGELEQARDAALESAWLKSEFLANMSHEIRTPMNGVIGMTGLLLDTELDAEQRDYTETIRVSADSLLTVINDILDFSKIEAGMLHFERLDFDLRDAVEGTVELLAARAQSKGLEIASLIESNLPTALRGDAGRLRQVITNLIGNAIKFTEAGEVTVRAAKESESETHVLVRFEVTDTGIGISEEAQRRLFQPFVQADGSTTRKYGGTGLGLAISRQLVELMGGEIGVESRAGAGSTFYFTARLEKQPAGAAKEKVRQTEAEVTALRVLVVDDNMTNRRIVAHQVASWKMRSKSAADGAEAITLLREAAASGEPFDLALLDMMMPGMDGLELAHMIKGDPAISQTQLVMLTSMTQRSDCESLRRAGLASCLTKPVKQSQLFDCLIRVMAKAMEISGGPEAESQKAMPNQVAQSNASTIPQPVAQRSARVLLADDNPINQKVALRQLEKLGYSADVVANGREALNMLALMPYDIVLMDSQMPEMDGYEATGEIRRREGTNRHTIIIAMTANALSGDREKCLAAGMDDYVSKPVKIEDLSAVLERWQPNSSNNGREQESPGAPFDGCPVDMERLLEASGGDEQELRTLTELYLRQTSEDLAKLNSAIKAGLSKEVKRIAHTCVGGSATCGMTAIVAPLRKLERIADEGHLDGAAHLLKETERNFDRIKLFLEEEIGHLTF